MKILILGGTKFLGRHLVDAALARGHDLTLFNRGETHPDLYPDVEKLRGDRDGKLTALGGRRWDAVIDTSGYVPRVVRDTVQLLADAALHYTFVSSISVYADFAVVGQDENAPVSVMEDTSSEDVAAFYGPLKALCEREVQLAFGDRALVVRPGLIVGPHDPTDRFTYWVRRFSRGGEVLVPGHAERPIQFIDARDLAAWMVRMTEEKVTGVFNATGPAEKLTMGDFVDTLVRSLSSSARPVWVDESFLLDHGVQEWSDLPLWISQRMNWPGFLTIDVQRAIPKGLTFSSTADTIQATYEWDEGRVGNVHLGAGLTADREAELLRKWKG